MLSLFKIKLEFVIIFPKIEAEPLTYKIDEFPDGINVVPIPTEPLLLMNNELAGAFELI